MLLGNAFWSVEAMAKSISMIAFGDSITAGMSRNAIGEISCPTGVDSEPEKYGSTGRIVCFGNGNANVGGYQPPLISLLDSVGYSLTIYNYGSSGIHTDEMIGELSIALNAHTDIDYVLIMGGANDAFVPVSTSTVRHNLELMVDVVLSKGFIPVLGTITPNKGTSSLDFRVNAYSAAIIGLANDRNILLADPNGSMINNWNAFHSGDKLHLNSTGNDQIASDWHLALMLDPVLNPAPIIYLLLFDD